LGLMKHVGNTFLTSFMTLWLMLGLLWSSIPRCGFLASWLPESKHAALHAAAESAVHGTSCHQTEEQTQPLGRTYAGLGCRCDLLDYLSTSLPPSPATYELKIASFEPSDKTWHLLNLIAELSLQPPLPPPRLT